MVMVGSLEIRPALCTPEPKCPECGAGVNRPKCLFEMGSDCPRHEVREEWRKGMLMAERMARSSDAGDVPMGPAW